ncbi:MAG: homoserine O-succinyltransferase, partial [Nitrosomonadaceae bacterium]
MPLVAHNNLPTYEKLSGEGINVLKPDFAFQQDIRELHIGLLNMMPDAALAATERQFFRLIAESNPVAQFFVHPFTLGDLPRGKPAREHIDQYYESFEQLREQGLDALIITGANVVGNELPTEPFWNSLIEVVDWADENVTSTLCSCLATHAVLEFRYGQKRGMQGFKKWGVFEHTVIDSGHPLVADINTRFDVPHSRWNAIFPEQFEAAGLKLLVTGDDGCAHLATSPDGFRTVFFQGHPEYDSISLLKEYKREIDLYTSGDTEMYPPLPDNYFNEFIAALLAEYRVRVNLSMQNRTDLPEFPESLILDHLHNTWHDSACAVVGRWIG